MRALSLSHLVEGSQAWVIHPQKMTRQRIILYSGCPLGKPLPLRSLSYGNCFMGIGSFLSLPCRSAALDPSLLALAPHTLANHDFIDAHRGGEQSSCPNSVAIQYALLYIRSEIPARLVRTCVPYSATRTKWYWVLDSACAYRWSFITGHHNTRQEQQAARSHPSSGSEQAPAPCSNTINRGLCRREWSHCDRSLIVTSR